MRTLFQTALAVLVLGAAVAPASAIDVDHGARLANACTSCHSIEGRSVGATPALAGQSVDDLLAKLKAYKDGSLEGTIMNRLARGYSDEELADLAAYFGSIKP